MKAAIYDRYGSPEVLSLRDWPEPPPAPGRARIRIHAAAINPKDVLVRRGKLRWFVGRKLPRMTGYDLAGVLLDDADGLARGTEVFAMIQAHRAGACAELASLPFDEIARKPAGLSMSEAASLPLAGLTALQALRDELELAAGETVLINGASGGVGTLAVQIAKAMGAEVHAVCSSRNLELVTQLGADRAIDYGEQSLAELRGYDCVFDVYGNFPWAAARASLKGRGRYCTTVPTAAAILHGGLHRVGLHRAALVVVQSRRVDLDQLRRYVEAGQLRPLVDRVVAFEDIAEGHAHVETRRTRGKVVVEVLGGGANAGDGGIA